MARWGNDSGKAHINNELDVEILFKWSRRDGLEPEIADLKDWKSNNEDACNCGWCPPVRLRTVFSKFPGQCAVTLAMVDNDLRKRTRSFPREGAFEPLQGRRRMSDDLVVLHDAERLRERAKQAREVARKSKDSGAKRLLIALAENFERLAEHATNEMPAAPSQTAAASP